MRKTGFLAAIALLGAIACDSVLDIEEPKTRTDEGTGAGGDPAAAKGGSAATSSSGSGGDASGGTNASGTAGEGVREPAPGGSGGGGGEPGAAGNAGEPPAKDCETGARRCAELAPEICDESGRWVQNADEAGDNCPVLCSAGACVECLPDERRCTSCEEGAQNCSPRLPQTCVDGAWKDASAPCKAYCDIGSGECAPTPSCTPANELGTTCQPGVSCCVSLLVPGGEFHRNFDNDEYTDMTLPATVSDFYLDKFEVTISRFRQFLLAYDQLPTILTAGAGKAPHIADDKGWNVNEQLPTKTDLLAALSGCSGTTWSDTPNADGDKRPVNCVPFNVAYAFCIWDGGRLPTDAELNFAASGGNQHRAYPWKAPLEGPPISADYATYEPAPGPNAVGLTPAGDGRWGQSDLSGNVNEWTLDYWGDPPTTCVDCINTTPHDERVVRGGAFTQVSDWLKAAARTSDLPLASRARNGFRCARDLE